MGFDACFHTSGGRFLWYTTVNTPMDLGFRGSQNSGRLEGSCVFLMCVFETKAKGRI
jgi:hypothetical protein